LNTTASFILPIDLFSIYILSGLIRNCISSKYKHSHFTKI